MGRKEQAAKEAEAKQRQKTLEMLRAMRNPAKNNRPVYIKYIIYTRTLR